VSPGLISSVTDEVIDEVKAWENRSLDEVYPIVYMDAIQFKVRDAGHVMNKAIYLAIGVNMDGLKEVLGLWIAFLILPGEQRLCYLTCLFSLTLRGGAFAQRQLNRSSSSASQIF